tara:strand:- start:204 stop:1556 length:1353 start_codon:yes stop_codon:yes gene_type:complete
MSKISVVGLGKLGLCLATVFAKRGFDVIGVDIREDFVTAVNKGRSPIIEPGLSELISEVGGKTLKTTMNHAEAIENSDITIILVSTPSNDDGSFSNHYVESALQSLATELAKSKKDNHSFIISSTVMPGSIESSFIPVIEEHSGRKLNVGFDVCHVPDFVALGDVINGFLKPELVVIGESSREAGEKVDNIYNKIYENTPYVAHMSLVSAEISKVSLNAYITLKISFANTLANLCDKTPNADLDSITNAIGVDQRISPYFFKGGLSFGGTCFPRDTKAFISFAQKKCNEADLIKAVEKVNTYQDQLLLKLVDKIWSKEDNHVLGVLGLAFKPSTPVIVESPAIKLIEGLLQKRIDQTIIVYDPLAIKNTRQRFDNAIEYAGTIEECLTKSSVCVVTTPDIAFKELIESFKANGPMTLIDCWRLLDRDSLSDNIRYIAWGYSQNTDAIDLE